MNSTIPEPSNTATVESVSTAMSCSVSAVDGVSRARWRAFCAARGWHTAWSVAPGRFVYNLQ
jgi:acetoin utilization deacetylase AcuC-like enzyme